MTLEEAIEYSRELAAQLRNDICKMNKSAEYEDQLANWLEELKDLRNCIRSSAFQDGERKGRIDTINNCIDEIQRSPLNENDKYIIISMLERLN